ncbi:MAG: HDOD domain-containing protein [Polyangiaceae bacterium]
MTQGHASNRNRPGSGVRAAWTVDELPLLPAVVVKLMSLNVDHPAFFEKVLEVASEDPPLAVRLISLANSAMSSPTCAITDIRMAVSRLGANRIAGLVTTLAVTQVFVPTTPGQRKLWQHALETALIGRFLCQQVRAFNAEPETVYLGGLLHDVGRFILFRACSQDIDALDEVDWDAKHTLADVERAMLGIDHTIVGAKAAQAWKLPQAITTVIREHHHYATNGAPPLTETHAGLTRAVQIADLVSVHAMPVHAGAKDRMLDELIMAQCIRPVWAAAPVNPTMLSRALPKLAETTQQLMAALMLGG